MAEKKRKKIIKFYKLPHINLGIVVFGIIFIYMLYNVFVYFTTKQVAFYEVSQGTIAQNDTSTGLILREETIYNADASGFINYYNQDATKAGVNTYIYSVDETGDFYQKIASENENQLFSQEGSYDELQKTAAHYVINYSDSSFYEVYTFKYDMQARMMEALGKNALSNMGEYSTSTASFHAYMAPQAGIAVYNTDGLEGVTLDSFSKDSFDESKHMKNNLLAKEKVNAGEPVYKLITSEIWNLVLPISEAMANDLAQETNIKVEFKKDNSTAWAASQIVNRDNGYYLVLTFQNSAIRFAADRYLDVKLLLSDANGLKIPNTALTEKLFFVIPKDYITKGGNSKNNGVLHQTVNKSGESVTEFVSTLVIQETEDAYYIEGAGLNAGDEIVKPDSTEKMTLKETVSLQGVYNINKGYAVFRKVEILFQNQEYTIVKKKTDYGISLYDHIALDASAVRDNQIVN